MVIFVQNCQVEITIEMCHKNLIRAIGKVLLMKIG